MVNHNYISFSLAKYINSKFWIAECSFVYQFRSFGVEGEWNRRRNKINAVLAPICRGLLNFLFWKSFFMLGVKFLFIYRFSIAIYTKPKMGKGYVISYYFLFLFLVLFSSPSTVNGKYDLIRLASVQIKSFPFFLLSIYQFFFSSLKILYNKIGIYNRHLRHAHIPFIIWYRNWEQKIIKEEKVWTINGRFLSFRSGIVKCDFSSIILSEARQVINHFMLLMSTKLSSHVVKDEQ